MLILAPGRRCWRISFSVCETSMPSPRGDTSRRRQRCMGLESVNSRKVLVV